MARMEPTEPDATAIQPLPQPSTISSLPIEDGRPGLVVPGASPGRRLAILLWPPFMPDWGPALQAEGRSASTGQRDQFREAWRGDRDKGLPGQPIAWGRRPGSGASRRRAKRKPGHWAMPVLGWTRKKGGADGGGHRERAGSVLSWRPEKWLAVSGRQRLDLRPRRFSLLGGNPRPKALPNRRLGQGKVRSQGGPAMEPVLSSTVTSKKREALGRLAPGRTGAARLG